MLPRNSSIARKLPKQNYVVAVTLGDAMIYKLPPCYRHRSATQAPACAGRRHRKEQTPLQLPRGPRIPACRRCPTRCRAPEQSGPTCRGQVLDREILEQNLESALAVAMWSAPGASNELPFSRPVTSSTCPAGTKRNTACGSMHVRMRQGQATRSSLPFFVCPTSRNPLFSNRRCCFIRQRQHHAEGAPLAHSALDLDAAVMPLDDRLRDTQPEARSP